MAPLTTYTATCWREGTSWTIRIAQLDRTARAARLSEAGATARRLIAAVTGDDPAEIDVVIDLRVPEGISRLLDAASAARQESDVVSVETVALRRTLARRLTAHGYGIRDIAVLLGVSYARAKQLAGDPAELVPAEVRQRQPVSIEPAVPAGSRPHTSYQHEAFLYRSQGEFLTGTVPFIEDAVAMGQPIMVALPKSRMQKLQAALGPYDGEVVLVDLVPGHSTSSMVARSGGSAKA